MCILPVRFCIDVNFIFFFAIPSAANAGVFLAFDENTFEVAFKHVVVLIYETGL